MLMSAFRLAQLFGRPVSELNITFREFLAWVAYLRINPTDKTAVEIAEATMKANLSNTTNIMATITNMSGRSLPKGRHVTADDFLGGKEKTSQPQSAEEQKAFMKSLTENKHGS